MKIDKCGQCDFFIKETMECHIDPPKVLFDSNAYRYVADDKFVTKYQNVLASDIGCGKHQMQIHGGHAPR